MISWANLFLHETESSLNARLIKDNACERSWEAKRYGIKSPKDQVLNFSTYMMPWATHLLLWNLNFLVYSDYNAYIICCAK